MTFEESLDFLNSYEPDDYRSLRIVQENWKSLTRVDRGNIERLYDIYFATIKGFLGGNDALALNGVQAYNFILAFSCGTTVANYSGREEAWQILRERHALHLDLLRRSIERPNSVLSERFLRTRTGTWADIVTSMLDLYYWHKPSSNHDETLRTDAAILVPKIYRAFPDHKSSLLPDHLMLHPDAIREAGELIRFYILEKGRRKAHLLVDLAYAGSHLDRYPFALSFGTKLHEFRQQMPQSIVGNVSEGEKRGDLNYRSGSRLRGYGKRRRGKGRKVGLLRRSFASVANLKAYVLSEPSGPNLVQSRQLQAWCAASEGGERDVA